ncbi:MAG: hypothetical protein IJH61_08525 [Eubacteriaceae bacterium]|nr:hypothetical protein [Eubacteriaceae bacterium]
MDYSTTDVISRIIDLDKQATDIIQNAKSQAEQIASNTKTEIRKTREQTLNQVKEMNRNNYDIEIEKAKSERKATLDNAENDMRELKALYEVNKNDFADEVLKMLLQS